MASQLLTVLSFLVALLNSGVIQALVKAIESIYSSATGVEKKAVAMKMFDGFVPESVLPLVSSEIDDEVEALNVQGVFKHKSASGGPDSGGSGPGLVIDSFAR